MDLGICWIEFQVLLTHIVAVAIFFSLVCVEITIAFGQRAERTFFMTLPLSDQLSQKKGGILFWMSLGCQRFADFSYGWGGSMQE
jgi:hypothetical protein